MKLPFIRKGKLYGTEKKTLLDIKKVENITGSTPPVDFTILYDVYVRDVDVFSAVNALTSMTVGVGVYVEGDEDAVEIINEFNEEANLDEKLFTIVSEMIWGGNSFWYKVYDGGRPVDLQHIPLTNVVKIIPNRDGTPKSLVIRVNGTFEEVEFSKILHFYLFKVDRELFGSPLIRPIAEKRYDNEGREIPELYTMKWMIEDYMFRVIKKYPPRFNYSFDVDDSKLEEFRTVIQNLRPGEDLVTNVKFDVKELSSDPASRFSDYIKHLDNKLIIGLMTVTHRLFTAPGFTEASANVAMDLQQLIIKSIQRKVKRLIESFYYEILEYNGLSDRRVRLNFGEPSVPELEYEHIAKFVELGVVTYSEARKMLADKGWPIEATGGEASEAVRPRQMWFETPDEVILQLVDPSDVDYSTVRHYSIDSEAGIRLTIAWVKSDQRRLPILIRFSKSGRDWTIDSAKQWYRDAFPQTFYLKLNEIINSESACQS